MPIPPAIHGRRATPSRRQPPTPEAGDTAGNKRVLANHLLRSNNRTIAQLNIVAGAGMELGGPAGAAQRRAPAPGRRSRDAPRFTPKTRAPNTCGRSMIVYPQRSPIVARRRACADAEPTLKIRGQRRDPAAARPRLAWSVAGVMSMSRVTTSMPASTAAQPSIITPAPRGGRGWRGRGGVRRGVRDGQRGLTIWASRAVSL